MIDLDLGVFIQTSEDMISQQKDWDETDACKPINFASYQFWLTTASGTTPEGFDSIEEAKQFAVGE